MKSMKTIRIAEPELSGQERIYINDALSNNELSGHGDQVREFERRFAEFVGADYALMVPNGTIAVGLALEGAGVRSGGIVILPSQTISVVAFAVNRLHASVVVVDVDKGSWTMSPQMLRIALNDLKARKEINLVQAIVPTPIFSGVSPDYAGIYQVLKDFGISETVVVEDFAEAIGSKYTFDRNTSDPVWKTAGSIGHISCTSFYANKTITTGEGGMVLTSDKDAYDEMKSIRNCAFREDFKDRFRAASLGFNYRPHNLVAAFGLGQMDFIDVRQVRKMAMHDFYRNNLSNKFTMQKYNKDTQLPVPWMMAILVPHDKTAQEFMSYMQDNNIETRPLFPPLESLPYFNTYSYPSYLKGSYTDGTSQALYQRGVLLPSGGDKLGKEALKYVANTANKFVGE